jgi:hypothetical protein
MTMVAVELVEAMGCAGWTLDGARRVRDEEGALVGVLDAELTAELVEFFRVMPKAEA